MSDRLISAEKILTKYQELCEGLACINCPFFGIDNRCGLESMILKEQIVNSVVRCKDCKWCHAGYCEKADDIIPFGCALHEWENFYCAWGERKENE